MPGGKLGHAIPNGGRGAMLSKGGGAPTREAERALGRRATRLRQLERPEQDFSGSEHSPVYRDRRALTRRGRQLMDNDVRASWRSLKNDGTMALVSVAMVALLTALTLAVDLREVLTAVLERLPLGPQHTQALLEGAMQWQLLETGCWWSAALLLAFFTWLLYAAIFDAAGMVLGVVPAVTAAATVFAARIAPIVCTGAEGPRTSLIAPGWLCSMLPWPPEGSQLAVSMMGAVAATTAAICSLMTFALRPRVPGPDNALALLSAAILAAIALTACSAPASREVMQMAIGFFAKVDNTLHSPLRSMAHLETGLWASGAILLAFFSWLLFAALYDAAGMAIGIIPAGAAASLVVGLRVVPAACRADPIIMRELSPQLCASAADFSSVLFAASVFTILLASSWFASFVHRSNRRKVLVVHSPLAVQQVGHRSGAQQRVGRLKRQPHNQQRRQRW